MMAICVTSGKQLLFKMFLVLMCITQLCFAQTEQRLRFSGYTVSQNTGQNYAPWLSDSLDTLVAAAWTGNDVWVDVTLSLATPGKVTKISLYDYQGVFETQPALIYALKGTTKTLLATFTGPSYMVWGDHFYNIPIDADAVVVHKFGNNIPQKIFVYGYPDTSATPVTTPPPVVTPPAADPDSLVKIPITASRWYQLNNVNSGLDALTDGITDVDVNTGWGKLIANFDAVYPVADGEKITLSKVKFFSYHGGLDKPMTLAIINSQGKRINVGVFKGFSYNTWLGPYPDRATTGDAQFNLDSTINDIKFLVINSNGGYPTEMELYGSYKAPNAIPPMVQRPTKLKQFFGINAFEWNFENGAIDPTKIDSGQIRALKSFTQVRHYMDWEKLETDQGSYTYNPTRNGGWNYDAIYQFCKDNGIEVLADLKQLPGWMVDSYPDSLKDSESVPLKYGKDFADPASYIEQAKTAFQYVARYGSNLQVDSALLSVNGTQRWTGDQVNVIKKGMGLIKYIECDNERDKWWKGRKGFQTAYEYAANLSAFYDGNKNTMGPGVGVKNADPSIKVVMCGLSHADPGYVRGMVDWCKQHRGYHADGSVNLCWDVINYHLYSNDANNSQNGTPTRGMAPEVDPFTAKSAQCFVQMAHEVAGDMPVWVTEVGYDLNQGSPYKAIQIGNKIPLQTQADWILRSSLLYARNGVDRVFFYQMYDDNALNPIQFGSSGLINDNKTRRPAADYLYQTNKLLGEYSFKQTLNADPIVDQYDLNGNPAYVLVVPDEKGRTASYSLDLPGTDSAKVYTLKIGADSMDMQYARVINGKLQVAVTETPVFVIPVTGLMAVGRSFNAFPVNNEALTSPNTVSKNELNTLKLYPNPSVSYVSVSFSSADVSNNINVRILNEQSGKLYKAFTAVKSEKDYSTLVDLSGAAMGVYLIQLKQGNTVSTKRLIKIN